MGLVGNGEEGLDLAPTQPGRLAAGTDEVDDAGRVANGSPCLVVQVAAHQQVAGEDLLRDRDLLAVPELVDVLHRDLDLEDPVLEVHRGGAGLEVLADLLLVTGLGMDHVPVSRAVERALALRGRLVDVEEVVLVQHLDINGGWIRLGGLVSGIAARQHLSRRLGRQAALGQFLHDRLGLDHRAGGQEVSGVIGRIGRIGGGFGFFGGAHQTSNNSRTDSEKIQSRLATTSVMTMIVMITTVV